MKLYQMEYYLAVCKCGSISRAAEELRVSRPAVSRAMKELEDEFGICFFLRTTTGVLMTDAGKLVYEKYRRLEQLFLELQDEIAAIKNVSSFNDRKLHIGISFTARSCLSAFLDSFRSSFPDIELHLTDLEDSFIDRGRLNPDYDLEISLAEDRRYEGVGSIRAMDSSFCFCCSPAHPLAGRDRVSLEEIRDEPLVGLRHLEQQDNQVLELFARSGLKPNVLYITQQVSFLCQMVRDGLGCAVKPRQSIDADSGIVVIPIDEAPKLHISILWSVNRQRNSAFRDFIAFSRAAFGGSQPVPAEEAE